MTVSCPFRSRGSWCRCVSVSGRGTIVPQRYPCGAVCGRGRSRRCGGGSCAGGRGTRTFHSGNGRSCCHRGRRACPVVRRVVSHRSRLSKLMPSPGARGPGGCRRHRESPWASSVGRVSLRPSRAWEMSWGAYLSRVDPLAGEGIVVRPHFGGLLSMLSIVGVDSVKEFVGSRRFSQFRCRLCGCRAALQLAASTSQEDPLYDVASRSKLGAR